MNARLAALVGGAALTAAALYRFVRARQQDETPPPAPDPRAEDLRRKLAESRAVVGEQEEFEAAETPVDVAEPVSESVEERRRAVHERGHAALDEMRDGTR